jgi:hypothetical protein
LTTVTDHRPAPLGKARDVRTAGKGSDHSIDGIARRARALSVRGPPRLVPSRQKGARRLPAKTEKTSVSAAGRNRRAENQMPGVADLARPAPHGGYRTPGLQNLLLNLYSLVKEHLISQAPPNAGESAVRRKYRRTRSSSAWCFSRLGSPATRIISGSRKLAGRDEQHFADQTCASSLRLSSYVRLASPVRHTLHRVSRVVRRRQQRCGAGVYSPSGDRQGLVKKIFLAAASATFRPEESGSSPPTRAATGPGHTPSRSNSPTDSSSRKATVRPGRPRTPSTQPRA